MTTPTRADLRRTARAALKCANLALRDLLRDRLPIETAAKTAARDKRAASNASYSRAYSSIMNRAHATRSRAFAAALRLAPSDAARAELRQVHETTRLPEEVYAAARAAGRAACKGA